MNEDTTHNRWSMLRSSRDNCLPLQKLQQVRKSRLRAAADWLSVVRESAKEPVRANPPYSHPRETQAAPEKWKLGGKLSPCLDTLRGCKLLQQTPAPRAMGRSGACLLAALALVAQTRAQTTATYNVQLVVNTTQTSTTQTTVGVNMGHNWVRLLPVIQSVTTVTLWRTINWADPRLPFDCCRIQRYVHVSERPTRCSVQSFPLGV